MYYRISFERSRVPVYERAEYIQRLDTLVRAHSKYDPAKAYRDDDSADWEVVIRSNHPEYSDGEHVPGLIKILRELKKRGCVIIDYVSCKTL